MNIKSLLLGSAAALVAATGARAADAIVIAEPEPMEYVRVCDMYGAGFFYIPGTENCLRIGGYMRYEMGYSSLDWVNAAGGVEDYRFWKFARFRLDVDARNETEWGTLRSYGRAYFNWSSQSWSGLPFATATGGGNGAVLDHGFIELQQSMGTLRLGKTDTAYARFLGYGSEFGPFDGNYAFDNGGELSYTFNGGNGFSAIIAAVESNTGLFEPRVEGGVNFAQGWGSIGAMVAYDTPNEEWGAKLVARGNVGIFSLGAHVFYASGPSAYAIAGLPSVGVAGWNSGASEWSVLGHARVAVTDKLAVQASVQWFDAEYSIVDDYWQVAGGLDWRPISGFQVMPEIRYTSGIEVGGVPVSADNDIWEARIRFQRSF